MPNSNRTSARAEKLGIALLWAALLFTGASVFKSHFPDRNWDNATGHFYSSRALFSNWYESDWMAAAHGTWAFPVPDLAIELFKYFFSPLFGLVILTSTVYFFTAKALLEISKQLYIDIRVPNIFLWLCISVSLLSPFWLGEIGTTFQNWLTAPFVLFSLSYLLRFEKGEVSNRVVFLIWLNLGLAVTFKLTNGIFVVATLFCFAYLILKRKLRASRLLPIMVNSASGFLLGLLPIIPWWIYTLLKTGNPIFPFYNKVFKSEYYPQTNFKDIRWEWHFPDSLLNLPTGWAFGTPVVELKSVDVRLPILLILCLLLFAKVLIRKVVVKQISLLELSTSIHSGKSSQSSNQIFGVFHVWVIVGTMYWVLSFGYVRYWVPIELLLGIIIGQVVFSLFETAKARLVVLISVFTFTLLLISPPNWNSSARSELGSQQDPWSSQLTSRVNEISGVMLTEGVPVSFLRVSNERIESVVGVDYENIPKKYRTKIHKELTDYRPVHFVTTNPTSAPINIAERLNRVLKSDFNLLVECENLQGPIRVDYQFCSVRLNP
jgi:hypothetical protein